MNIAAAQFAMPGFVDYVTEHLARAGIPASDLCLEVTEGTLISDLKSTSEKLQQLRELGISISIDDFGTGYSSLSYLQQLPIDSLKIDRSFVTGVHQDPQRQSIVESILYLARGLRLQVIAEGVETEQELAFLRRAGCTLFQGYYFFKPAAAQQLIDDATTPHAPTTARE